MIRRRSIVEPLPSRVDERCGPSRQSYNDTTNQEIKHPVLRVTRPMTTMPSSAVSHRHRQHLGDANQKLPLSIATDSSSTSHNVHLHPKFIGDNLNTDMERVESDRNTGVNMTTRESFSYSRDLIPPKHPLCASSSDDMSDSFLPLHTVHSNRIDVEQCESIGGVVGSSLPSIHDRKRLSHINDGVIGLDESDILKTHTIKRCGVDVRVQGMRKYDREESRRATVQTPTLTPRVRFARASEQSLLSKEAFLRNNNIQISVPRSDICSPITKSTRREVTVKRSDLDCARGAEVKISISESPTLPLLKLTNNLSNENRGVEETEAIGVQCTQGDETKREKGFVPSRVNWRFIESYEAPVYPSNFTSLFFINSSNPIRRGCYRLMCSSFFRYGVVICILLNIIVMAADQPRYFPFNQTIRVFINILYVIFIGIFLLEMIVKVFALGFILHPNSYLRYPMNILDFILVVLSLMVIINESAKGDYGTRLKEVPIDGGDMLAVRAIRLLTPLFLIPSMKELTNGLMRTFPKIWYVIVILGLNLVFFAVLGVHLTSGIINNRCYLDFPPSSNDNTLLGVVSSPPTLMEDLIRKENFTFPLLIQNNPMFCSSDIQCQPSYDPMYNDRFIQKITGTPFADIYGMSGNVSVTGAICSANKELSPAINYHSTVAATLTLLKIAFGDNLSERMRYIIYYYNIKFDKLMLWTFLMIFSTISSYFLINLFLSVLANACANNWMRVSMRPLAEGNVLVMRKGHPISDSQDISVNNETDNIEDRGTIMTYSQFITRIVQGISEASSQTYIRDFTSNGHNVVTGANDGVSVRRSAALYDHSGVSDINNKSDTCEAMAWESLGLEGLIILSKEDQERSPRSYTPPQTRSSSCQRKGSLNKGSSFPYRTGGAVDDHILMANTSLSSSSSNGSISSPLQRQSMHILSGKTHSNTMSDAVMKTLSAVALPPRIGVLRVGSYVDGIDNGNSSTLTHSESVYNDGVKVQGNTIYPVRYPSQSMVVAGENTGSTSVNHKFKKVTHICSTSSSDSLHGLVGQSQVTSATMRHMLVDQIANSIVCGDTGDENNNAMLEACEDGSILERNREARDRQVRSLEFNNVDPISREESNFLLTGEDNALYGAYGKKHKGGLQSRGQCAVCEQIEKEQSILLQERFNSTNGLLQKGSSLWFSIVHYERSMGTSEEIQARDKYNPRPRWKVRLGEFVECTFTSVVIMLINILSVISVSVDYYGMPFWGWIFLHVMKSVTTILLFLHISCKTLAFGVNTYSSPWNVFDVVLVVMTIPDVFVRSSFSSVLTIVIPLRTIRILRPLQYFRSFHVVSRTISQVSHIGFLLLLVILLVISIYSVMGMKLFGLRYEEIIKGSEKYRNPFDIGSNSEILAPLANFGSVYESFLLCFIIITGDNWTDYMMITMDTGGLVRKVSCFIFFFTLFILVRYILVNLFVAVVIDKLGEQVEESAIEMDDIMPPLLLPPVQEIVTISVVPHHRPTVESEVLTKDGRIPDEYNPLTVLYPNGEEDTHNTEGVSYPFKSNDMSDYEAIKWQSSIISQPQQQNHDIVSQAGHIVPYGNVTSPPLNRIIRPPVYNSTSETLMIRSYTKKSTNESRSATLRPPLCGATVKPSRDNLHNKGIFNVHNNAAYPVKATDTSTIMREGFIDEIIAKETCMSTWISFLTQSCKGLIRVREINVSDEHSLFIFPKSNPLRRFCVYLIGSKLYEIFIIISIIVSGILALIDVNTAESDIMDPILFVLNAIFTTIFFLESIIMIIAYGLVFPGTEPTLHEQERNIATVREMRRKRDAMMMRHNCQMRRDLLRLQHERIKLGKGVSKVISLILSDGVGDHQKSSNSLQVDETSTSSSSNIVSRSAFVNIYDTDDNPVNNEQEGKKSSKVQYDSLQEVEHLPPLSMIEKKRLMITLLRQQRYRREQIMRRLQRQNLQQDNSNRYGIPFEREDTGKKGVFDASINGKQNLGTYIRLMNTGDMEASHAMRRGRQCEAAQAPPLHSPVMGPSLLRFPLHGSTYSFSSGTFQGANFLSRHSNSVTNVSDASSPTWNHINSTDGTSSFSYIFTGKGMKRRSEVHPHEIVLRDAPSSLPRNGGGGSADTPSLEGYNTNTKPINTSCSRGRIGLVRRPIYRVISRHDLLKCQEQQKYMRNKHNTLSGNNESVANKERKDMRDITSSQPKVHYQQLRNQESSAMKSSSFEVAYLRNPWNLLDVIVNFMSILALFYSSFGILRALRLGRVMDHIPQMRPAAVNIICLIPYVIQGTLVSLIIFFIFGVMGKQLFQGQFYSCSDISIYNKKDCVGMYNMTVEGPLFPYKEKTLRQWERKQYHFDDTFAAMTSLFVGAFKGSWSTIMYNGMSTSSYPDLGTSRGNENKRPIMALFFMMTFIIYNFFSFSIMVGIVVNYYTKIKQGMSVFLSYDMLLYRNWRNMISDMWSNSLIPYDNTLAVIIDQFLTARTIRGMFFFTKRHQFHNNVAKRHLHPTSSSTEEDVIHRRIVPSQIDCSDGKGCIFHSSPSSHKDAVDDCGRGSSAGMLRHSCMGAMETIPKKGRTTEENTTHGKKSGKKRHKSHHKETSNMIEVPNYEEISSAPNHSTCNINSANTASVTSREYHHYCQEAARDEHNINPLTAPNRWVILGKNRLSENLPIRDNMAVDDGGRINATTSSLVDEEMKQIANVFMSSVERQQKPENQFYENSCHDDNVYKPKYSCIGIEDIDCDTNDNHKDTAAFDDIMYIVIVVNSLIMISTNNYMKEWELKMAEVANICGLTCLIAEMCMKMFAYGISQYFTVHRNKIDFIVVVLGLAQYWLEGVMGSSLLLLSVPRMVRLLRRRKLMQILTVASRAFPSFFYIFFLQILVLVSHAVIGVYLFRNVKYNGVLTSEINFYTVSNAIILLYQINGKNDVDLLINALSLDEPFCSRELGNCGNGLTATILLHSYFICTVFFFGQIFLAVIVGVFLEDRATLRDPIVSVFSLLQDHLMTYFDITAATSLIPVDEFIRILPHLPQEVTGLDKSHFFNISTGRGNVKKPSSSGKRGVQYRGKEVNFRHFGRLGHGSTASLLRLMVTLELPVDSKFRVRYRDIIESFIWRKLGVDTKEFALFSRFPNEVVIHTSKYFVISQYYAAVLIQIMWRQYKIKQARQRQIIESAREMKRLRRRMRRSQGGILGSEWNNRSEINDGISTAVYPRNFFPLPSSEFAKKGDDVSGADISHHFADTGLQLGDADIRTFGSGGNAPTSIQVGHNNLNISRTVPNPTGAIRVPGSSMLAFRLEILQDGRCDSDNSGANQGVGINLSHRGSL